ncbi:ribosomal protein L4 [Laetiporus sulphureus 93-53]|uniref:Large ribosomal subunit protein uL4m n=1 Tax=Laetiporus sulphureus 93-53 TaxID=1314785 RepID=A0A165CDT6_9APHY|nr:ribosomal protein L4 [Laetiporus sulphureus 93-53]KZT02630.1 ribosomal protein L4 [Laetiporus sulphureus 93-53]
MFSACRRVIAQVSRPASRGLSTISGPEALIASSSVNHAALNVSLDVSLHEPVPSHKLSPFTPPVYLSISSLLPPLGDAFSAENVVELDPHVFSHPIRRDILHLCVTHYLDSIRQGTASTKTRGDVRGSGRKIRPQKGTGRARLGDGQSPMLRGGGVAHGPKPRDFSTKLNRKVIQMGMRVALSARVKENALGVVENLNWTGGKTKQLDNRLQELGWRKTLFVSGLEHVPQGLQKASSNLKYVQTSTAKDLKVYDLVKWPRIVLDFAAVDWFERTLGRPAVDPRAYSL